MAANEKKLGRLHEKVADIFISALDRSEAAAQASTLVTEDGEEVSIGEVNPALLNAATKFLKDNEITCTGGEGSKADELREKLKKKRVGNVVHLQD